MKIRSVRAYCKNLSLQKPYTIAYKTISAVENVFIEIELENGICGIGAANPDPDVVNETIEQTLANLQSEHIQKIIGYDIRYFNHVLDVCEQEFPDCPGTLAAIDIALHDAFGQFLNTPIVKFYGQKKDSLLTSITIGIKDTLETLKEAAEYYQQGFRVVKVKTGEKVDEDIERILKLYEVYKTKLTIRVDANQGYTLKDLIRFIKATENTPVELIEQPLAVGNESELLTLPDKLRKKIAADESLKNPSIALKLAQSPQPFGIFNIKLMKCGGIRKAMEIGNISQHASIDLFWGCNDESIVSITAALHTAFACSTTRYIDLDGSFDLAEDIVTGGFVLSDGYMKPIEGPGLGLSRL